MGRTFPAHSSRDFETELRALRAHLCAMGTRCEQIVGIGFDGFLRGTSGSMSNVLALDALIDRDELEIHALILRILALRQPVADDLRFLAAAMRLVTDLERVGDEAVNIAERAGHDDGEAVRRIGGELDLMARGALDMLHVALDAFVHGDDEQAHGVAGRDDEIDRRCAAVIAEMAAWMKGAGDIQPGLRAIWVAKYLERIADHATNVAEEVIFMVRGEDRRRGRSPWEAGSSGTGQATTGPARRVTWS